MHDGRLTTLSPEVRSRAHDGFFASVDTNLHVYEAPLRAIRGAPRAKYTLRAVVVPVRLRTSLVVLSGGKPAADAS